MKPSRFLIWLLVFILLLAIPASLVLAVPVPTVTLSGGGDVPIGSSFSVTATFDNTDLTDTGYGPFIDVYLPVNGADGAGNTSLPLDGVDFVSASYLGASVTTVVQTFPDTPLGGTGPDGTTCGPTETPLAHPYAVNTSDQALTVCGTPGDKLVTVQLPFGSFTPSQPPASVTLDLQLHDYADLGTPLTLYARGGFQFGSDPLDNPCCDPALLSPASSTPSSWPGTTTVTPTLMELSKSLNAPEGETATGPNYPRSYTVTVTVPAGQTVNNVNVTDYFDDNIVITNVTNITGGGSVSSLGGVAPSYPYGPAAFSSPNNELVVNFPAVSGTASFDVLFYVPDLDASASSIINPTTGDDVTTENRVSATGSWTPTDPRDSVTPITINGTCPGCPPEVTLTDKSIAIQKSSAIVVNAGNSGVTPGDVIEYTLDFQISDYFTFGDIEINDIISDGQRFDNTFTPIFTIADRVDARVGTFNLTTVGSPTTCSAIAPTNDMIVDTSQIGNDTNPATDGSTSLTFCISQALLNAGAADGILQGGYTQGNTAGSATGTITYRVVVQDQFSDTYPSGDPSVDHGDTLTNTVTISGTVRDNTTITTTVGNEDDTSGNTLNISQGSLTKSIYQINGAAPSGNPPEVFPGDIVTYRLQYQMPSSDFEDFSITDFLPLPVFDVTDPDQVGGPGPAWVFNGTPSATAPAPGTAHPHSSDTFFANCNLVGGATCLDTDSDGTGDSNVPVMTIDATSNSVTFQFGDFDDPSNVATVIDILFSVTVSTDPFADSLFLTNQAQAGEGSTNSGTATSTDIIQIELREPSLSMDKGVIATDSTVLAPLFTPAQRGPGSMTINPSGTNPSWTGTVDTNGLSAAPINSDLSDVDAGDLVTFAIVLENSGGQGAFDIQVKDALPPGFVIPSGPLGLNLQVRRGDGFSLSTAPVGSTATHSSGLFDDGIEILDPGAQPACQPASPTSGQNIIIVTYDLQVAPGVEPGELILNQAEVRNYSNQEGGQNFLDDGAGGVDPITDDASTTILNTSLNKTSPASNAAIGETYQYTITANIPEGQMSNAQVVDNLTGIALVQCDNITASPGLSTSVAGGFANVCSSPSVTNSGQTVTFDFGTLTNSNTDNVTAETLTITYTVVALNINGNTDGSILDNNATLSWDTPTQSVSASAPDVTVVEPQIDITKTFSPDTGDAGDASTVTIAINNSGTSTAYDIVVTDVVPADMTYSGGSLATTCAGATTDDTDPDASVGGAPDGLTVSIPSLANSASCNITFDVTIDSSAAPTQSIINTANVTWTSQPGSPTNTAYNANGVERTGDNTNPGELHNYSNSANDTFTVDNIVLQKTLVTSSETFTSDSPDGSAGNERPLAIGEIVTFQLAMSVPEGTSTTVFMRDTLVSGLQYIAGSTEIATINGTNLTIQGMPTAQDMPTFTPVTDDTDGAPTGLGEVRYDSGSGLVEINLGNITNLDTNDAQTEQVVIRFDALVLNSSANNLGQVWQNNFSVEENGTTIATSNDVGVIVVEPQLSVTKTATPNTGDAGDTISYSIIVTNANGANNTTAFDVSIVDNLPAGLINMSGVTVTPAGGASGVTDNSVPASGVVDVTIDTMPVGSSVTLAFTVDLDYGLAPNQQVQNTTNVTYTSLPGTGTTPNPTGSTAPGASGAPDGERDGSDGVGGALNDLAASANETVTVDNVALQKTIFSTSEAHTSETPDGSAGNERPLAIGEIITFQLTVDVPEGTSNNIVFSDTLIPGLQYMPNSTVIATNSAAAMTFASIPGVPTLPATTNVPDDNNGAPTDVGTVRYDSGSGLVEINIGDVTNNDGDADTEQIVVRFDALVLNSNVNNINQIWTNEFSVTVSGNPAVTSNQVRMVIVEPQVSVVKTDTTSIAPSDAGDPIQYTLTVTNASNANTSDAFDVNVTDTLPAEFDLTGVTVTVNSGNTYSAFTNNSDTATDTVSVDIPQMAPGDEFTIVLDGFVRDTVLANSTITNTGDITYTSLPGNQGTGNVTPGNSGDSDGERNGNGTGVNDYNDSDSVNTSLPATPSITKGIVATSDANTGTSQHDNAITDLTIGETVTYELTVTLHEGTDTVIVVDTLPTGITPQSATVTAVGSNITGSNLSVGDTDTTSADITISGQQVTLDFGTVVNTGDNVLDAQDQLVMQIVGLVTDVVSNDGTTGTDLVNDGTLNYVEQGGPASTNDTESAEIVEPELTLSKTRVGSGLVDGGDTLTFQITLDHTTNSTSDAHNIVITDVFPTSGSTFGGVVSANTTCVGVTSSYTAPNLTLTVPTLALATDNCVIEYTMTLGNDVLAGSVYNNSATATYDSLTGGGGRTKNLGPDTVNVTTTTPSITKGIVATSDANTGTSQHDNAITDLTIGETVTYELTVTLHEGTDTVIVVDTLPTGITPQSATVTAVGSNITGSNLSVGDTDTTSADITISGQQVTFDFGTVVNTGDNVLDAQDQLVMQIVGLVTDVVSNDGTTGTDLVNDGTLNYVEQGGPASTNDTESAEIVEPELTLSKTRVGSGLVDGGDTLTFQVTLTHTTNSTSDAHNIVITDVFPPPTNSSTFGTVTANTTCVGVTSSYTAPNLTLTVPTLALSTGNCMIEYTMVLGNDVSPSTTYSNNVTATYDSLAGGGGRTKTTNSATVSFDTGGPGLLKGIQITTLSETGSINGGPTNTDYNDAGIEDLAIGEEVTFALTVTLIEGNDTVRIVDTLPAGLVPVSGQVVSIGGNTTNGATSGGNITYIGAGTPLAVGDTDTTSANITISGQQVTFDFGDLNNAPDGVINTSDQLVVYVTARVADVVGNTNGTDLINDGQVQFSTGNNNGTATVEVVTPATSATKTFTPTEQVRGGTVVMQLVVSNLASDGATAPTYDISVVDILDDWLNVDNNANITVSFNATATAFGSSYSFGPSHNITPGFASGVTDDIEILIDKLPVDGVATITVTMQIDPNVTGLPRTITNTATVTSDTMPGNDSVDRDDTDTPSDTLNVVKPTLLVSKSDSVDPVNAGGSFQYTITVQNTGTPNFPANNVVLTDNLPSELTLDLVQVNHPSNPSASCSPLVGTTLTCNLGTINQGETVTLTLDVTVAPTTPTPTTLNNEVYVDSQEGDTGSGGTPADNDDERAEETTTVDRSVDLQLVKTVDDATPQENDLVTFTMVIINNGPSQATNVVMTDDIPAGITFSQFIPNTQPCTFTPGAGAFSNGQLVCTFPSLANGASETVEFEATVDSGTSGTAITNSASVTATETESNNANNSDSATINVETVDIQVTKIVDNAGPTNGQQITYTVTVHNNGPGVATNLVIRDTLPTSAVSYVSDNAASVNDSASNPTSTSYSAPNLDWSIGQLNAGANISLQITVDVTATSGTHTNTAALQSVDQTDSDNTNNSDSVDISIGGTDIAVDKTVDDTTPNEGDTIVFTITATNNGPGTATNIVIADTLPAGVTYVSHSAPNDSTGTPTTYTGSVWNIGQLNNGQSRSLQITATVDNGTGGSTIINTATRTGMDQTDTNNANDSDTAQINVNTVDLAVTKTVDNPTPNESDTVVYSVTVTNNGPGTATGVSLADTLPAGVTYVSDNSAAVTDSLGNTTAYNSGTGIWTIGQLNNGASVTLQITATVDGGTSGSLITNTASVNGVNELDSDNTNDSDSADIAVAGLDLAVTKTVDNPTPLENDTIVYSVTVTNNGPGTATNIVITDDLNTLPVTYVSDNAASLLDSASNPTTYSSATGAWSIGQLNSGDSLTLQITVTVDAGSGGSSYNNTASLTSVDQPDGNSGNNSDTATITVTATAVDIAVTKVVDNPGPSTGSNVTYTITVVNNGPSAATGVIITEDLPLDNVSMSYVSHTASKGTFTPGTPGTWNIGNLANGETVTLQLTATVNIASGSIVNTASVSAVNEPDSDNTNDSDSATITIGGLDLSVSKVVNNSYPQTGDTIVYTIVATNNGPNNATNVVVTDILPAGVNYISDDAATVLNSSGSPTSFNSASGDWTIGDLNNGDSLTLNITAQVTANGGTINNTATITGDQPEADNTNNSDTATINVGVADLRLVKNRTIAGIQNGEPIQYTITVYNDGPADATGVQVRDNFPSSVTFSSATPSQGTFDNATGIWDIGNLPAGNSVTLVIDGVVNAPGDHTNIAEVIASDQPDADSTPNNNVMSEDDQDSSTSASVFDPPFGVKTVNANGLPELEWTMVWINPGSIPASGTVGDTIPAGTTYVNGSVTCTALGSSVTTLCTYDAVTNRIVWQGTIGADPGATNATQANNEVLITFRVTVQAGITHVENQASFRSSGGVSTPIRSNLAVWDAQPGVGLFDPAIVKLVDPAFAQRGEEVNWIVTVYNNGDITASNVVVSDTVPPQLNVVGVDTQAGTATISGQDVTINIGDMAPGTSVEIVIRTVVRDDAEEPFVADNVAVMSGTDSSNQQPFERTATATLISAQALPNTGETPLWRNVLLGVVLMSMLTLGGWMVYRRNR